MTHRVKVEVAANVRLCPLRQQHKVSFRASAASRSSDPQIVAVREPCQEVGESSTREAFPERSRRARSMTSAPALWRETPPMPSVIAVA